MCGYSFSSDSDADIFTYKLTIGKSTPLERLLH